MQQGNITDIVSQNTEALSGPLFMQKFSVHAECELRNNNVTLFVCVCFFSVSELSLDL